MNLSKIRSEIKYTQRQRKVITTKISIFEKYKNSFKNLSFIHDSGQRQIDLVTLNRLHEQTSEKFSDNETENYI